MCVTFLSNSGNIGTIEKFREILTNSKGVILITDDATGDQIHLIKCTHVTEANFNKKVIQNQSKNGTYYWYENIPHAMKDHLDFQPCGDCHPEMEERKNALNQSGTFLQISVKNQLDVHNWDTEPEFPVTLAPFIKDPMKYPGISASTPGIVRPSMFQQAVSESQNQFLKKETSIDALGSRIENKLHYLLCTEVKKLNPKYVDWCFFQESILENRFRVTTKSVVGGGLVDLMTTPNTDRDEGKEIHIQIEYLTIPGFSFTCSDYGVALHKDLNTKKYKFQNSSLNNAVSQCIEGTYGTIVNALVHQVTTGDGYNIDSQIYIPVVVTNANLLYCKYNVSNINTQTGEIDNLDYQKIDHIVYEYPLPMSVQFPKSILGTRNAFQNKIAIRWPVLIVNPKGLENLLTSFENGVFNLPLQPQSQTHSP